MGARLELLLQRQFRIGDNRRKPHRRLTFAVRSSARRTCNNSTRAGSGVGVLVLACRRRQALICSATAMLRHDDTWRTLLGLPATTAAALSHAPPAVRSERTDDKDFISDAKNGEWINANPRCIKDDKVRAWTTWLFEWRTWIVPTFLLLFVFIHFFSIRFSCSSRCRFRHTPDRAFGVELVEDHYDLPAVPSGR